MGFRVHKALLDMCATASLLNEVALGDVLSVPANGKGKGLLENCFFLRTWHRSYFDSDIG